MANNNFFFDIKPNQIALARKTLSIRQKDFAKNVDLSVSSYNGIETGKVDPKLSTYIRIIHFLTDQGIIFHEDGNVTKNKL